MEQKLTAQIAAAYFGCQIQSPHGEDNFVSGKMESVTERVIYFYISKENVWSMGIANCKLILSPLSEITDEHAVEVAKIGGYSHPDNSGKRFAQAGRELLGTMWISSRCNVPPQDIGQIIDYLRPKSYDLGYGNMPSLIAAGVAVAAPQNS